MSICKDSLTFVLEECKRMKPDYMIVWKLLQGNLPYKLTYGQLYKRRILLTIILF